MIFLKGASMFRDNLKKTAWQLPLMVITACVIGISVNNFRSDAVPYVGDWSEQARFIDVAGENLAIGLDEAEKLFERQKVLFVDARPKNQYADGHIQGALNLPWQEADRYFMELIDRLDDASMIITYCDGEHCDLSLKLALYLKKMSFENVRVLVNGWTVWQQATLPTKSGD